MKNVFVRAEGMVLVLDPSALLDMQRILVYTQEKLIGMQMSMATLVLDSVTMGYRSMDGGGCAGPAQLPVVSVEPVAVLLPPVKGSINLYINLDGDRINTVRVNFNTPERSYWSGDIWVANGSWTPYRVIAEAAAQ